MSQYSVSADSKKKKQFVPADNPVEIMKDFGAGVVREAFEQIGLKPQKQPLSGEIELASGYHKVNEQIGKIEQKDSNIDAKMRQLQYVQRNEKEVFSLKQRALQEQIGKLVQDLQVEVVKLQKQTSELSGDVKKITVETKPAKMGIYHLNFFDQVLAMLKEIRKSVAHSREWLKISSKKKQQKGYWAMFKKHGTNFAMSDERAVASSNG